MPTRNQPKPPCFNGDAALLVDGAQVAQRKGIHATLNDDSMLTGNGGRGGRNEGAALPPDDQVVLRVGVEFQRIEIAWLG